MSYHKKVYYNFQITFFLILNGFDRIILGNTIFLAEETHGRTKGWLIKFLLRSDTVLPPTIFWPKRIKWPTLKLLEQKTNNFFSFCGEWEQVIESNNITYHKYYLLYLWPTLSEIFAFPSYTCKIPTLLMDTPKCYPRPKCRI